DTGFPILNDAFVSAWSACLLTLVLSPKDPYGCDVGEFIDSIMFHNILDHFERFIPTLKGMGFLVFDL
ncbi:MAG: hypothetical protein HW420_1489, partial [Candidatus Nitrosotenuis sp.]|nr:hypothetical protein [Candidatus Nitrosotenuis sp.]